MKFLSAKATICEIMDASIYHIIKYDHNHDFPFHLKRWRSLDSHHGDVVLLSSFIDSKVEHSKAGFQNRKVNLASSDYLNIGVFFL